MTPSKANEVVIRLPDGRELEPTMKADAVAAIWGISEWEVYQANQRGDLPVAPLKIGKRILRWPTAPVYRSVGIEISELATAP